MRADPLRSIGAASAPWIAPKTGHAALRRRISPWVFPRLSTSPGGALPLGFRGERASQLATHLISRIPRNAIQRQLVMGPVAWTKPSAIPIKHAGCIAEPGEGHGQPALTRQLPVPSHRHFALIHPERRHDHGTQRDGILEVEAVSPSDQAQIAEQ